ncbi:GNAT family N-acetyltransferase [Niastella caeni]|uniref:GNAT family N-acetyltransferase n=1 Tax=Niastella caeni TaxID=2569763 RepID=A0A4V4H171_9BACT|nr:GNAT family N-acetyltransferase [Niastella caeni]THU39346.1 GNAT family N-acetyltransferase [Niastella caeni]
MNIAVDHENELHEPPVPELKNKTPIEAGTKPNDGYSIEVVTGPAVITFLNDPGVQKSWDLLFDSCSWATVFQGRQFIAAWYLAYSEEHLPILITAVERGQLKGALPLVLLNSKADDEDGAGKGKITGAGHYDGLYQAWLTNPSDGNVFIKKALAECMKKFPGHPISLRFLPPGTPLNWTKDDKQWRQYSIVQPHARPLILLNGTEEEKIFQRRKHFKHKLNRLKRAGEVSFETVRDVETFKSSLHAMAIMYDFRHSALFNKNPFNEDPVKKDFLLELFRLQLLHVTVLKVDGKIIGGMVAVTDKGWVSLAAINCHSPVKARWHSPGFLHFVLASKQFEEEGFRYFDLTPGYDAYKEELANGHDEVIELVISSEFTFRIKRKIKKWLHGRFIASGIRPMTVELNIKRYLYLMRRRTAMSVIKILAKRFHKKRKPQLYQVPSYTLPTPAKISLHKDNLTDLMQYNFGRGTDATKWEFLGDAMFRLERSQHCYTWIENGRLMGCAWFGYPEPSNEKKENNNPEAGNTIEFQHIYCHSAAKDRLSDFLKGVIDAAVNKEGKNRILTSDPLLSQALEAAGFSNMLVCQ